MQVPLSKQDLAAYLAALATDSAPVVAMFSAFNSVYY